MRCFKPQTAYLSLFLAFLSVVFLLFVPLPVAAIDGENTKGSVPGKSSQNIQLPPLEIQWLKTHKTVRVSGPGSFPPFRYFENGTVKGMDSDYTLFLAGFIGLQIEDERKAHTMGIKAFIMKPITMSVLARTVREVLDSL
jgi:hypothetical protein